MAETNSTEVELELWLRVVHGFLGSVLLFSGILCSCSVLLLVACNRKLQYPSIVISLGLVLADLILGILWILQVLLLSTLGEWTLGQDTCTAFGVLLLWLLYVRWSEIAVVTMDRFLIVIFPFFTYRRCSKPLMIIMTILAWFVPAVLVLPSFHGFGRHDFRLEISACTVECDGEAACTAFYTALFGLYLIIGGMVPATLYITMYCTGVVKRWKYKNRKLGTVGSDSATNPQQQSSSSASAEGNSGESENRTASPQHPTTSSSSDNTGNDSTNTTGRRSSRLFRLLKPRERRALTTVFIIFISMVITHIPTYFLSAVRSVGTIYADTPLIVHFVSIYIFLLGLVLDSIIIVRNKDFRDVITKMFKRRTVIPVSTYNPSRRPSMMLLLSVNGRGKLNGSPATGERRSSCSVLEGRTGQDGIMNIIFAERSNLSTLHEDKSVVTEESCYQHVTEV